MRQSLRQTGLILGLALGAALLMGPTWPRDDTGTPAGQCSFIGSTGVPTLCSTTDPLPTGGAPTQSTTDPTGFGKAFFDSNGTSAVFTGRAGTPAVFVTDQTAVAFQMASGASPTAVLTYLSQNGGRTWALVSTSTAVFNMTNSNTALRFGNAYLVGMIGIGALPGIMRSVDGTTWTNLTLPGAAFGSVTSIAGQGTTVLLGVNSTGQVCRSTTSGASFASCVDFAAITGFTNSAQGIASPTASTWLIGGTDGSVGRSTDDGGSFTLVLSMGGTRAQIVCLSSTVCLAASGVAVHRSTNGGATWTNVFAPNGVTNIAGFVNYGSGVVVTVPSTATSFFRSVDFGATWNFQGTMPHALGSPLGPIDVSSGRAIIAQGQAGSLPPVYSPVVGAGETIIAGQSGNRWDIDAAGAGLTRARIVDTGGTEADVTPGLRLAAFNLPAPFNNQRTCSEPAANTAATISIAGVAGQRVYVWDYLAFYTTAPAAAQTLTITAPAGTNSWLDIVSAAANTPTARSFSQGLMGTDGVTVTITLPAGGAGVVGKLCATMSQHTP